MPSTIPDWMRRYMDGIDNFGYNNTNRPAWDPNVQGTSDWQHGIQAASGSQLNPYDLMRQLYSTARQEGPQAMANLRRAFAGSGLDSNVASRLQDMFGGSGGGAEQAARALGPEALNYFRTAAGTQGSMGASLYMPGQQQYLSGWKAGPNGQAVPTGTPPGVTPTPPPTMDGGPLNGTDPTMPIEQGKGSGDWLYGNRAPTGPTMAAPQGMNGPSGGTNGMEAFGGPPIGFDPGGKSNGGMPADWELDDGRTGGVRPWDQDWKGGADPTHGGPFYRPKNWQKYGQGGVTNPGQTFGGGATSITPAIKPQGQIFGGGPVGVSGPPKPLKSPYSLAQQGFKWG